jgi:DNA polymerase III subunit gamma/tau
VSGQEHVTRTLANAIARNKVVHAYLFTGPRGVGKTSIARILSKALNCHTPDGAEPCQQCASCKEISAGTSLAVREIDGASHNSVDNVRDLIDSFKALPPPGYKFKVYIIDEVHMLSISAFNALLKSLEEPPPNTVFILATTEIHKIPETVISRCQRHDFRALSVSVIEARLADICRDEGLQAEKDALTMIARLADGSMRDAQTLLDRVQTFCAGSITAADASKALGSIERAALLGLSSSILKRDVESVLSAVSEIFSTGIDPVILLKEFVSFWREVFIAKLGGETRLRLLGLGDDSVVEMMRLVASLESIDVHDLWDVAREGADRCLRSSHPRYGFEALTVRMATRQPMHEIGKLIGQVAGASSSNRASAHSTNATPTNVAGNVARPQLKAPLAPEMNQLAPVVSAGTPATVSDAEQRLSWEAFLTFVESKGGRIMLENLKRMRPARFVVGALEATGPDFTVSSLTREKVKLEELLAAFAGEGSSALRWKLALRKGEGSNEGAAQRAVVSKAQQVEDLASHPALQSLQKVFPGSKVEQVKLKQ